MPGKGCEGTLSRKPSNDGFAIGGYPTATVSIDCCISITVYSSCAHQIANDPMLVFDFWNHV